MNTAIRLFAGVFATFAFAWVGLVLVPHLQMKDLQSRKDEALGTLYPAPFTGMESDGRDVYIDLGCTYCHNTQAMGSWELSPPARTTAWHGIRMVQGLNADYLTPLQGTFPENRLGPTGDVAKANCATCHQGVFKPLYGVTMLDKYPSLAPMK